MLILVTNNFYWYTAVSIKLAYSDILEIIAFCVGFSLLRDFYDSLYYANAFLISTAIFSVGIYLVFYFNKTLSRYADSLFSSFRKYHKDLYEDMLLDDTRQGIMQNFSLLILLGLASFIITVCFRWSPVTTIFMAVSTMCILLGFYSVKKHKNFLDREADEDIVVGASNIEVAIQKVASVFEEVRTEHYEVCEALEFFGKKYEEADVDSLDELVSAMLEERDLVEVKKLVLELKSKSQELVEIVRNNSNMLDICEGIREE